MKTTDKLSRGDTIYLVVDKEGEFYMSEHEVTRTYLFSGNNSLSCKPSLSTVLSKREILDLRSPAAPIGDILFRIGKTKEQALEAFVRLHLSEMLEKQKEHLKALEKTNRFLNKMVEQGVVLESRKNKQVS